MVGEHLLSISGFGSCGVIGFFERSCIGSFELFGKSCWIVRTERF